MLAGCTVHPPGESDERRTALAAGKIFEPAPQERHLPDLPETPTPADLVRRALLANDDLEARYWQWRAAIEQIPQDATQSSTPNLSLGTLITRGRTASDMTTLGVGNDPMTDIKLPAKLDAAAMVALDNARAAGLRFRKAQFDLRNKVLSAYSNYSLNTELIRLADSNQALLDTMTTISEAQNRAGKASQQDVLKAKTEADLAKNDIANMKSQLPGQRAALNAFLARPPDAPIALPDQAAMPTTLPTALDDAAILSAAAQHNPDLAALAADAQTRKDAVLLARLQYFPDFNLSAATDLAGITQNVIGQVTLPFFRHEALDAAIAQAHANLHAAEAMQRQASNDLAAQVVLDLSTIHDADRQLELFTHTILPRARQAVDLSRTAYESGHSSLLDALDTRRTLISVERLTATLHAQRAKRLADLESITAQNLEFSP